MCSRWLSILMPTPILRFIAYGKNSHIEGPSSTHLLSINLISVQSFSTNLLLGSFYLLSVQPMHFSLKPSLCYNLADIYNQQMDRRCAHYYNGY